MTIALDGLTEVNSTEACTVGGTCARAIRSNPNFGKKRSAVAGADEALRTHENVKRLR